MNIPPVSSKNGVSEEKSEPPISKKNPSEIFRKKLPPLKIQEPLPLAPTLPERSLSSKLIKNLESNPGDSSGAGNTVTEESSSHRDFSEMSPPPEAESPLAPNKEDPSPTLSPPTTVFTVGMSLLKDNRTN